MSNSSCDQSAVEYNMIRCVRGRPALSAFSKHVTKQFLDKLQQITMQILDKRSSGTRVETRYLRHPQIMQRFDKPFSYSRGEVDLAKKEKEVLTKESGDQIITDSLIDLLAVDDNHIFYKLQSLSKHCSDHWLALGCIHETQSQ